MESGAKVRAEPGVTVLRAENQVKEYLGQGLWHGRVIDRSGLQPNLLKVVSFVPGALPQAGLGARRWRLELSALKDIAQQ